MNDREPGSRVGAILSSENGVVKFLGYGVYEGDEVPPTPPSMLGIATWEDLDKYYESNDLVDVEQLKRENRWPIRLTNPKIVLDNGDIVWGQECWWGPEDVIKEKLEGLEIVEVSIEEARSSSG